MGKGGERRGYGWVVGAARACGLYTCMLRFVILLVFLVCASVPLFARGGNINSIYHLVRWLLDIFLFTCLSLSVDTSGSAFHVHCMFRALFAPSVYMCM